MPPPRSCAAPGAVRRRNASWCSRLSERAGTWARTRSWRTPAALSSINASTVYRALDTLVDAGIAKRTDLHAGYLHFELTRGHRHHHAVCQQCGAVAHIHDDVLAAMARKLASETGFALSPDREITIPRSAPTAGGPPRASEQERSARLIQLRAGLAFARDLQNACVGGGS